MPGAGLSGRWRSSSALESLLRGQTLQDERDWKRIDAVLPVLQGAARGLQLRAARSLPVLGQEPGRVVPMLTLRALYKAETKALKVCTEVLETVQVWRLPLPEGQQLEMVMVPGGEYLIGSPEEREGQQAEAGRDVYPTFRQRCEGLNEEAQRTVRLDP